MIRNIVIAVIKRIGSKKILAMDDIFITYINLVSASNF